MDTATILDGIRALGIAGGPVFAVLWWLERAERKECQATVKEMLTQVLTVTLQATTSITSVTVAVTELRGVMQTSTTSLAQLIRSMKKNV